MPSKQPTPAEVQEQIKKLEAIKPTVLKRSAFGDDHHAAIDAQIEVLKDRLTDAEIFNREDSDAEDWKQNMVDAAIEARMWLDGEPLEYKDLADGWKGLVR